MSLPASFEEYLATLYQLRPDQARSSDDQVRALLTGLSADECAPERDVLLQAHRIRRGFEVSSPLEDFTLHGILPAVDERAIMLLARAYFASRDFAPAGTCASDHAAFTHHGALYQAYTTAAPTPQGTCVHFTFGEL